jgi:hypothetical protein
MGCPCFYRPPQSSRPLSLHTFRRSFPAASITSEQLAQMSEARPHADIAYACWGKFAPITPHIINMLSPHISATLATVLLH